MARDMLPSFKRPDWPIEQTGGCDWPDLHLTTMYHLNSKTLATGQGDSNKPKRSIIKSLIIMPSSSLSNFV
jgi:hypothetical protein